MKKLLGAIATAGLPTNSELTLGIRPEAVRIATSDTGVRGVPAEQR